VVSTATGSTTTFRLFVAAPVPAGLAASIEAAIDPWRDAVPRARWTPPERRHLTLRFLGSTDRRRVPWIEDRLAEAAVRCRPFEVVVRGLGAFPSPRRARVLWVGLDDAEGSLAGLAGAVQEALAPEFPPDRRPFSPHMTVARCDPPIALPMREVGASLEIGSLAVGEVALVRSHLGASPRYETLARFPLGADGAARG
jgi:2'-5' RNA ligase